MEKRQRTDAKTADLPQAGSPAGTAKKVESLGKQMFDGVEAEGMRTTLTIPAGEIGNTCVIEIVDEVWYAPALQLNVITKHSDPRSGEKTYRLTQLSRNEPERSLFEIPAGYTVKNNLFFSKPKPSKDDE